MQMDYLAFASWTTHGLSPMTAKLLDGSRQERTEERKEAQEADSEDSGNPLTVPQMGRGSEAKASSPLSSRQSHRRTSDSSFDDSADIRTLAEDIQRTSLDQPDTPSKQLAQTVPDQAILAYLTRTLAEVGKFRQELSSLHDSAKKAVYPPLVLLSSRKTPTVKGCVVDGEQDIVDGKYDRLLFGEGGKLPLLRTG